MRHYEGHLPEDADNGNSLINSLYKLDPSVIFKAANDQTIIQNLDCENGNSIPWPDLFGDSQPPSPTSTTTSEVLPPTQIPKEVNVNSNTGQGPLNFNQVVVNEPLPNQTPDPSNSWHVQTGYTTNAESRQQTTGQNDSWPHPIKSEHINMPRTSEPQEESKIFNQDQTNRVCPNACPTSINYFREYLKQYPMEQSIPSTCPGNINLDNTDALANLYKEERMSAGTNDYPRDHSLPSSGPVNRNVGNPYTLPNLDTDMSARSLLGSDSSSPNMHTGNVLPEATPFQNNTSQHNIDPNRWSAICTESIKKPQNDYPVALSIPSTCPENRNVDNTESMSDIYIDRMSARALLEGDSAETNIYSNNIFSAATELQSNTSLPSIDPTESATEEPTPIGANNQESYKTLFNLDDGTTRVLSQPLLTSYLDLPIPTNAVVSTLIN